MSDSFDRIEGLNLEAQIKKNSETIRKAYEISDYNPLVEFVLKFPFAIGDYVDIVLALKPSERQVAYRKLISEDDLGKNEVLYAKEVLFGVLLNLEDSILNSLKSMQLDVLAMNLGFEDYNEQLRMIAGLAERICSITDQARWYRLVNAHSAIFNLLTYPMRDLGNCMRVLISCDKAGLEALKATLEQES